MASTRKGPGYTAEYYGLEPTSDASIEAARYGWTPTDTNGDGVVSNEEVFYNPDTGEMLSARGSRFGDSGGGGGLGQGIQTALGLYNPQIPGSGSQFVMDPTATQVAYSPGAYNNVGNQWLANSEAQTATPYTPIDESEADYYTAQYGEAGLADAQRRQANFDTLMGDAASNRVRLGDLSAMQGLWGNQLAAAARGEAPSAAATERQYALEQAQRQALSTAAGARQAGAYRGAFDLQAELQNQAARDAMVGRANEMAQARSDYTSNLAGQAQTLQAQQGATQLGGTLAASAADAANTQASTANAISESQYGQESGNEAARLADYTARQNAAQGYGELANTMYGTEADMAVAQTDANLRGEEIKSDALKSANELETDVDKFNAEQAGNTSKGFGGLVSSFLSAASLSDVRAKENITPYAPSQAQRDLRSVGVYGYDYKDPTAQGAAPGRQVGPMAQELAATPTFAGAVQPGADGMLAIDPGRLTLGTLAAQKGQQEQIDQQQAEIDRLMAELDAAGDKAAKANDVPAEEPAVTAPEADVPEPVSLWEDYQPYDWGDTAQQSEAGWYAPPPRKRFEDYAPEE